MQELNFIHGEICRVYGGQYQTVPTAPEHEDERKEKEEWEGDWDAEKAANDWYESATVDLAVDLVWSQNAVEALEEDFPAHQEMESDHLTALCSRKRKRRHGK